MPFYNFCKILMFKSMVFRAVLLLEDGTFLKEKLPCRNYGNRANFVLIPEWPLPRTFPTLRILGKFWNTHVHIGNYGAIAEEVSLTKCNRISMQDFNDNFPAKKREAFPLQSILNATKTCNLQHRHTQHRSLHCAIEGWWMPFYQPKQATLTNWCQQLLQAPVMHELASMVSTHSHNFRQSAAQFSSGIRF